jgi:hypothetical protein
MRPSCDEWGCPLATPLETILETDEERMFRETEENKAFDEERLRKATQAQSSHQSNLYHSAKQQMEPYTPYAGFIFLGVALSLAILRAKMRARIFGVLLWVRDLGVDVAHGRGTERMARWRGVEYTRLPTMVER